MEKSTRYHRYHGKFNGEISNGMAYDNSELGEISNISNIINILEKLAMHFQMLNRSLVSDARVSTDASIICQRL